MDLCLIVLGDLGFFGYYVWLRGLTYLLGNLEVVAHLALDVWTFGYMGGGTSGPWISGFRM